MNVKIEICVPYENKQTSLAVRLHLSPPQRDHRLLRNLHNLNNTHPLVLKQWERGNQEQSLLLRSEWISLTQSLVVLSAITGLVSNASLI
jgi:ABC-type lipoprotein release transport system permease subunit